MTSLEIVMAAVPRPNEATRKDMFAAPMDLRSHTLLPWRLVDDNTCPKATVGAADNPWATDKAPELLADVLLDPHATRF